MHFIQLSSKHKRDKLKDLRFYHWNKNVIICARQTNINTRLQFISHLAPSGSGLNRPTLSLRFELTQLRTQAEWINIFSYIVWVNYYISKSWYAHVSLKVSINLTAISDDLSSFTFPPYGLLPLISKTACQLNNRVTHATIAQYDLRDVTYTSFKEFNTYDIHIYKQEFGIK